MRMLVFVFVLLDCFDSRSELDLVAINPPIPISLVDLSHHTQLSVENVTEISSSFLGLGGMAKRRVYFLGARR